MKQFIIEIDEGTLFDGLPEDQKAAIRVAQIQWPDSVLHGTEPVDGRQLIMILTAVSASDIEGLISDYEYDWQIRAEEGVQVDQVTLIPFFSDTPVFDEDGEQTGAEPVTELTGKIQIYSGHQWTF